MGRGYISDTEARLMGLHKLEPIPTAFLPPNGDRIRTMKRKIDPQHLASILDRMLADPTAERIDIGREMALQLRAICKAIVSSQQEEPGTGVAHE